MLKSAFTSPKIRMLAARLGVPFPHAVGVCGLVWNFTADHAPRGDIGKHGDFEIAAAAEWHGDPAGFVEAMVSCRLLDRDDEFRLLVHDWAEHCPRYVHATLKRKNASVVDRLACACARTHEGAGARAGAPAQRIGLPGPENPVATVVRTVVPTAVRTAVATVVPTAVATTSSSSSSSSSSSASSKFGVDVARRNATPPAARRRDPLSFDREAGWTGVTEDDRAAWKAAYPGVDVPGELARAGEWCRADWQRRKKTAWRRFVVAWLARTQDAASRPGRADGHNNAGRKPRKGW